MRRMLLAAAAALAAAVLLAVPAPAGAVTHSPCAGHTAVAPYVSRVDDGVTTLSGAGGIGGCPVPVGTESVTVTVALQWLDPATQTWVDQVTQTWTRSWNRYSRFARQAGGVVYAVCVVGDWRTQVTGGDGFPPFEWSSDPVTMVRNDSGVCGVNTGGGD